MCDHSELFAQQQTILVSKIAIIQTYFDRLKTSNETHIFYLDLKLFVKIG